MKHYLMRYPPIYDFARICRACPEQGDRERVYRHHRQNGDSPQKINGDRACLSFMLYISSILLVCCCCGHRWFLFHIFLHPNRTHEGGCDTI